MKRCEKWTIAYRKRLGDQTILDDVQTPFIALPNTWRYWRADPFLFERNGKTFLFAELYDRVAMRGVIGCCELNDKCAGCWKVIINEPFHLSYPFVFEHNGIVYMIPETFRAGGIILYKAVNFPYGWEQVKNIADYAAVDSTVIEINTKKYIITVRVIHSHGELVVIPLDSELSGTKTQTVSVQDADQVRPAGNVFVYEEKLIRPSQDCSAGYGFALNFFEILKLDQEEFKEKLVRKVLPSDVCIRGVDVPEGIHTYNFSDHYEVIDYKEYEFGLIGKIAKAIRLVVHILLLKKDG